MALQKAYLEVEASSDKIECMFNPAKFSFSVKSNWKADGVPGKDTPEKRFAGGESATFDLSLIFDTTSVGTTVTAHTNKLLKLVQVATNLPGYDQAKNNGRPPWVKFHWGTQIHSFKAIITSVSVSYTYFSSDGIPLRATVDLNLEQYEPDANWGSQNPTSGTPKPHRSHQVQVGDSLDRLAARYYGDSTQWRSIATANGIKDPLDLRPGSLLAIPERMN